MRVTVSAAVLRDHVTAAGRFIAPRPALPILSNILIGAKGGRLTFFATDIDASLMTSVEIDDCEEGRVTLPAAQLAALVGKLPNADVLITSENDTDVELRCQRSKFKLRGLKADDYPEIQRPGPEPVLVLPSRTLGTIIGQVLYAAKGEKGNLDGIYARLHDGVLTAMAADGYRMAYWQAPVPSASGTLQDILPSRALKELGKLLKADDGDVSIYKHGDTQIGFQVGDVYLSTKLVAAMYPDFSAVIPQKFANAITVNRVAFLEAVERVSVMSGSGEMAVLILTAEGTDLNIEATGSDQGGGEEAIGCSGVEGKVVMSLRAPYIVDALRSISTDEVMIGDNASPSPTVFRPVAPDAAPSPLTACVMPVRV